jgi:frizzled protein 5/8
VYILAPLGILLLLGTSFLLAGFIALVRIRSVIAKQAGRSKTEKLEKLMIRIGVFSVLYTLPASAVIGAHLYEMSAKQLWLQSITCGCKPKAHKPLYSVLMLK